MHLRTALSFRGRFSRKQFWLYWLGAMLGLALAMVLMGVLAPLGQSASLAGSLVVGVAAILASWVSLATQVKRWHDQNRSGWMVLVTFIPFVGFLISLICLGFLRGTPGDNRFGPPPGTTTPSVASPFIASETSAGAAPPRLVEPVSPPRKLSTGARLLIIAALLVVVAGIGGTALFVLVPPAEMAARRSWVKATLTGSPAECQTLAWRYRKGDGFAQDFAQAAHWFGRAADKGLPQAQYDLAVMHYYGMGIPGDADQAKTLLEAAVRQDYVPAMTLLGLLRDQLYPDDEEARNHWERAAQAGDPWAELLLGSRHLRHRGDGEGNENLIRALYWLECAHRDGVETVGGLIQHVWATVPEGDLAHVTDQVFGRLHAGSPEPLLPETAPTNEQPTTEGMTTTADGTPPEESHASPLAGEVLAQVRSLPDYVTVSTLYAEKSQEDPAWPASDEGQAVGRYLQVMRSNAESVAVRDMDGGTRVLVYSVGGHELTDADVRFAELESDADYRRSIVEAVARNIVGAPRPMAVNDFLRKAGKN